MDPSYWLTAWKEGRTGFHNEVVHPALVRFEEGFLSDGPHRVLVPLCGKSHDLPWMAARGHDVVGVELAEVAIREIYAREGIAPECVTQGPYTAWQARGLTVLQGDVLALDAARDGTFDRVWDRAALVALDPERRVRYVAALRGVLRPGAVVLLETFAYDQARKAGPPHSVPEAEVRALWAGAAVERLDERDTAEDVRKRGWDLDSFLVSTWRITLP